MRARTDRIGEEMRRGLDALIRHELRDPRIAGTYSITRVEVTRDMRYAKVRFSVLETENRKPMLDALAGSAGFLRKRISQDMKLRFTPELLFEIDENIEYGARMADLIRRVVPPESAETRDNEEMPDDVEDVSDASDASDMPDMPGEDSD